MKRTKLLFILLQIPVDLVMIVVAFLVAYWVRLQSWFGPEIIYIMPLSEYVKLVLLIALTWIIIFALTGMYNLQSKGLWNILYRIFIAVSVSLSLFIIFLFGIKESFFSRLIAAYAWVLVIIFVFIGRIVLSLIRRLLIRASIIQEKIVIIGDDNIAKDIGKFYKQQLVKVVFMKANELNNLNLYKDKIDQIILTTNLSQDINLNLINFCETNGIRFKYLPNLISLYTINAITDTIYNYPLIELVPTPLEGWGRIVKRLFDFVISSIAIVVFSPVLLMIAILVKLDSPGPALFIQERPGQFNRKFKLYKFRSMYTHMSTGKRYGGEQAENLKAQLKNESSGLLFKMKNDPRITKFGNFIRRTSLDELPQLFNIVAGEMSLVGPRPPLPSEVSKYNKKQFRRLLVKPGLTGMWQVSGRSETSFEEYLKLDMYYIEHWSLWLDIKIIFKTIWVVLKGEGAY